MHIKHKQNYLYSDVRPLAHTTLDFKATFNTVGAIPFAIGVDSYSCFIRPVLC